jgi:hypothetical protein
MANLGVRALAMNDAKAAVKFAKAALELNPTGNRGQQLAMAARFRAQDNPFGDEDTVDNVDPFGAAVEENQPAVVDDPFGSAPAAEATPEMDKPMLEAEDGDDIFGSSTKSNDTAGSGTKMEDTAGSGSKMEDTAGSEKKMDNAAGSGSKPQEDMLTDDATAMPFNDDVVSDDISAPLQMGSPVGVNENDIDRILAQARDGGKDLIVNKIGRKSLNKKFASRCSMRFLVPLANCDLLQTKRSIA